MKKNLYYRTVFRRENRFLKFLYDMFLALCSWPRLVLEVFIRKNFGERYFNIASAISVAVILLIGPYATNKLLSGFSSYGYGYGSEEPSFWGKYATWYIFTIAFLYFSYLRWKEIKRNPSVFDFGRFSLCTGEIHPVFYNLKIGGKSVNVRSIEILYEPAAFFLAGVLLALIGQKLGWLWIFCSIFYCLGYAGAYHNGDNFVMDKIDEMILNEEMEDAFVGDKDASETRGVRFYTRKPTGDDLRRQVADSFIEDDKNDDIADVK